MFCVNKGLKLMRPFNNFWFEKTRHARRENRKLFLYSVVKNSTRLVRPCKIVKKKTEGKF